jgi:hypothetical protein
MNAPRAYAEWLSLLERFAAGDDSVIQVMEGGSVEWTNVVAERWTLRVTGALDARLGALSKRLQTSLDRARGDYHAIANALVEARRGLVSLRAFLALRCLPEVVRSHLAAELDRWITETQASLERSVKDFRHDQGRLAKTIRDNPLTMARSDPPWRPDTEEEQGLRPASRERRVIIL